MIKLAFFDTKSYDKIWFDKLSERYDIQIKYFENKLNADTAVLAMGYDAVCAFVNDRIDKNTIKILSSEGVSLLAMRCAGYNNIDLKEAKDRLTVVRVPDYSPYSVAEHSMALLLAINRKIPRAYIRTRDFNFSLSGMVGFDLHGRTAGIIGTGRIGRCFIDICKGIGMNILAYDKYPADDLKDVKYTQLDELFEKSDVISLHCPLNEETYHILNKDSFKKMKNSAIIVNTSRGALINSEDLCLALKQGDIGAAALDVYEEEADFFYEDKSDIIIKDDTLARIISMPNVIVTSHQAFLTEDALRNIAKTTLQNICDFFEKKELKNKVT